MGKSVRIVVAGVLVLCIGTFAFADDKDEKGGDASKAKHTIKDVMAKALKGNKLNKKVLGGEATQEEKLELLDMYISLVESKPPKGDEASWQRFAGASALAAAKVAVGREGARKELKTATNCAKCHKAHKPPAKK